MDDERFLAALEACELGPEQFDHAAHVRAGYLYLRRHSFPEAAARTSTAIRRFAASLGKAERYHETLTMAFLALIAERLREDGDAGSWQDFWRENAGRLTREAVSAYYPPAVLDTPAARSSFILPRVVHG